MTFERTEDMRLVREILTEPSCWRRMVDDLAPGVDEFDPRPRSELEYIVARENGGAIALFVLVDIESAVEVHFCFRPKARLAIVRAGRAFVEWVWAETDIVRLIGPVPGHNGLALRLAKACGFTEIDKEGGAVRKDGQVYDRILLEARRPGITTP